MTREAHTDTSSGGNILALQEALQVPDLEVADGLSRQRPGGEHSAGGAHDAAAAAQAAAAVVPLAFTAGPLPSEHAELHGTTFARHIKAAPSRFHLAYLTLRAAAHTSHYHKHILVMYDCYCIGMYTLHSSFGAGHLMFFLINYLRKKPKHLFDTFSCHHEK